MLTHSEIGHLPVPEKLFDYAEAYRSASAVLCQKFGSSDDVTFSTWPHATVVLMLAAHAVELFLKGALLKRNVEKVRGCNHSIDQLAVKYRETFQNEPSFAWDIPFEATLTETEWISLMKRLTPDITEVELKDTLKKMKDTPDPSILFRYPVNNVGKGWPGLYGLYPPEFSQTLSQVELDFNRIRSQLR